MNKILRVNLQYLLENVVNNEYSESFAHVYLHEYMKNSGEQLLQYLEKIKHSLPENNYIKYPFLVGYDTIINKMHNYHSLIPELLNLEISSIEDLFMFHEILTFINTMMYDEFDQIRKKYQSALETFAQGKECSLLDLLIKMSVSMRFVNVSLLKHLSNAQSDDDLISSLHQKYDDILNEKGMYDIYML